MSSGTHCVQHTEPKVEAPRVFVCGSDWNGSSTAPPPHSIWMLIFVSVSVFALFNPKITIIQGLWRKINDSVTLVLKDVEVGRWRFSLSWMALWYLSVVKPTSCCMFIRTYEFTADSAASCSRYLCWAKLLNILSFIKVRFISFLRIRFECWQSYQDGTLRQSVGFISHIHAVKSREKTFGKWDSNSSRIFLFMRGATLHARRWAAIWTLAGVGRQ